LIQLTDILGVVTASDSECEVLSSGEELDDDDELWELDEIEGAGIDGDSDDDSYGDDSGGDEGDGGGDDNCGDDGDYDGGHVSDI
jgi:hypothetical protein